MKRNHITRTSSLVKDGKNGIFNTIVNSDSLPSSTKRKIKASIADVRFGHPNFYTPLFQAMNILLPRDRRERNEWATAPCIK